VSNCELTPLSTTLRVPRETQRHWDRGKLPPLNTVLIYVRIDSVSFRSDADKDMPCASQVHRLRSAIKFRRQ